MIKKIIVFSVLLCIVPQISAFAVNLDRLREHYLKGEWREAIKEGERQMMSAKYDSRDLDRLYFYLGICYIKERNLLRASDIFEIVVKEFPRSRFVEQSYVGLIDAYSLNGQFNLALERSGDFLKKYPQSEFRSEIESRLDTYKAKAGVMPAAVTAANSDAVDTSGHRKVTSGSSAGKPVPVVSAARPLIIDIANETAEGPADEEPAGYEPQLVLAPQLAPRPVLNGYFVQVGAFSKKRNAENVSRRLRNLGFSSNVSDSMSKGKTIYKVRVGAFDTRYKASVQAKKLSALGYPTKIIP